MRGYDPDELPSWAELADDGEGDEYPDDGEEAFLRYERNEVS